MALAFPQMQASVGELFLEGKPGRKGVRKPEIDLVDCESLGLVNDKPIRFGTLQHVISAQRSMVSGVVMGVMTVQSGLSLAPALGCSFQFVKGDRIVVCRRKLFVSEQAGGDSGPSLETTVVDTTVVEAMVEDLAGVETG